MHAVKLHAVALQAKRECREQQAQQRRRGAGLEVLHEVAACTCPLGPVFVRAVHQVRRCFAAAVTWRQAKDGRSVGGPVVRRRTRHHERLGSLQGASSGHGERSLPPQAQEVERSLPPQGLQAGRCRQSGRGEGLAGGGPDLCACCSVHSPCVGSTSLSPPGAWYGSAQNGPRSIMRRRLLRTQPPLLTAASARRTL